jgi:hypothetical protein
MVSESFDTPLNVISPVEPFYLILVFTSKEQILLILATTSHL